MEDWNMLAADCVIISCCCQCLVLEVIIFILIKLPYKLVQKMKECAKKKLQNRTSEGRIIEFVNSQHKDRLVGIHGGSLGIQLEDFPINRGHGCAGCMEEVEIVLEEFSKKGEFAFGSFWGREDSGSFPPCVTKQEFDANVAQYHIIEMTDSFSHS